MSGRTPPAAPHVGGLAPPLALPSLNGAVFELEDCRGRRPMLVSFLRHAG